MFRRSGLVLVVIGMLAVASCASSAGHSSGNGSSAPAASTGGSTVGVTSTSIRVEGLFPVTAPNQQTFTGMDIGAKARFVRQNAQGGVYGRKIDYVQTVDEGGQPSTDLTATRQITQSNTFAIVPMFTQSFSGAQLTQASDVPVVGWLVASEGCGKTNIFGITGCANPPSQKIVSPASARILANSVFGGTGAGKTVVLTVDDAAYASSAITQCGTALKTAGFTITGTVRIPTTATDFTPYVGHILQPSGGKTPDVVFMCNSAGSTLGITGALQSANYKGVMWNSIGYDPRLLESAQTKASLQGSYSYLQWAPWEADTAAVNQMRADVEAVAPGTPLSLSVEAGYLSADLFIKMATAAGPKLTRQRLLDVANSNFTWSVPGLSCPASFPADHNDPVVGGGEVKVAGAQFKAVDSLSCFPASQLITLP